MMTIFEGDDNAAAAYSERNVPKKYKDSTPAILLIKKGGGFACTKYLCTTMHLGKGAVDENKTHTVYVHTSKMLAGGLTKLLEGKEFQRVVLNAKKQIGWYKITGGHWVSCSSTHMLLRQLQVMKKCR